MPFAVLGSGAAMAFLSCSFFLSGFLVLRSAGLIFFLRVFVGRVFGLFFFGLTRFVFLGDVSFADALAVVQPEHHDHVVRLLLAQDIADRVPPIEGALGIVTDQAGALLVLADDGNAGIIGKRVIKTVTEPIGHAVAHDHDGRRGRLILFRFRSIRST